MTQQSCFKVLMIAYGLIGMSRFKFKSFDCKDSLVASIKRTLW